MPIDSPINLNLPETPQGIRSNEEQEQLLLIYNAIRALQQGIKDIPSGVQGSQGSQGVQGTQGAQGDIGVQGSQGSQGNTGVQGATGAQGSTGNQGSAGAQGAIGSQGNQGSQGSQGVTGSTGAQGSTGSQGTTGSTGAQGAIGSQGNQGFQGIAGAQGASGAQGSTGSTGSQGATGTSGAQGSAGSTGAQGATGATGAQGATGSGISGLTTGRITLSVTSTTVTDSANLLWDQTNKKQTITGSGTGSLILAGVPSATQYFGIFLEGVAAVTADYNIACGSGLDLLINRATNQNIVFKEANGANQFGIYASGDVIMGVGSIATNATHGFFRLDSCAGTPSGTPASYSLTGDISLVYDRTNNKLYAYNGAWKSVTLT